MTMKGRKTIKKPSFIFSYWQCLIFVAAFVSLIGVMIYGSIHGEYTSRGMRNTGSMEASMSRTIATALNKEKLTAEDITILKQQLIWNYSTTGQIFEVYFNNKKIADSSRTMIFHYCPMANEGEDPKIYFFELADKKYLEYFDTPEVQQFKQVIPVTDYSDGLTLNPKYNEQPMINVGVKEAYVNYETGKFIPVTCYILDPNASHSLSISGTTVNIPIDKNSPELKGYTYIRSDGIDNYGGSIEGYESQPAAYKGEGVSTNDYGIYYGYKSSDISFVPFEKVFKTEIMIGNSILVIVILALTLIPAAFLYSRKKRNYEIFEYRRKTTDAMAHDLKTPMAAILSYAENLENHTGEDKQEFYVSKISEKVWQMNKMVNNMLDFSRGENDSVPVKKTQVNIGAVIADAIAENDHEITKRGLTVNFENKEVMLNTDKDLFAQAIGNLINNAALYAKESSSVSVTCEPGKIVISNVSAAKIEDAEALKQPFAKGDESRKNYGSGLGLAIADNNLTMLGFKLDVKSEDDKFIVTVTL